MVAADSGSHTCLPYFISILNLEPSRVCRKCQYVTAARRILAPECAVQTMRGPDYVQSRLCAVQTMCSPDYVQSRRCAVQTMCSPDYVQSRLCAVQTMCSPDDVQSRLCAVQTMCSPDYVQYRLRIQALECSGRCSQRQPHTSVYRIYICSLNVEQSRVDRKSQYVTASRCIPAAECTIQ